ncbi:MAG: hypothetical protein AB3N16_04280 [Flavobacteriaceae bacterium]
MPKLAPVILPFILLFACCKGQEKATDAPNGEDKGLELVLTDTFSDMDQPETMVVKNQKDLKKFFVKVNRTRKPGLPLPVVDFEKEMLLIYCSGRVEASPTLHMEQGTDGNIVVGIPKKSNSGKHTMENLRSFSIYKLPHSKKEVSFQNIK